MQSCSRGMLFVVTILLLMKTSMQQWSLRKYHVRIVNELPRGSPLEVHCKSADDDLGDHTVWSRDEYVFTFRENFFMTTLFWCNLRWVSLDRRIKGDVFWPSDGFLGRCKHQDCVWRAKEGGLEFRDPYTDGVFVNYGWS